MTLCEDNVCIRGMFVDGSVLDSSFLLVIPHKCLNIILNAFLHFSTVWSLFSYYEKIKNKVYLIINDRSKW